jgi:hypothetical protein
MATPCTSPPRWIAYSSDDSGGRREIWVTAFLPGQPMSGARGRISQDGGTMPRWCGDGRELYDWALDGWIMAAPVDGTGTAFRSSTPVKLFTTHRPSLRTNDIEFDVTRDGRRFVLVEPAEETTFQSLTVVTNWPAAVRR